MSGLSATAKLLVYSTYGDQRWNLHSKTVWMSPQRLSSTTLMSSARLLVSTVTLCWYRSAASAVWKGVVIRCMFQKDS